MVTFCVVWSGFLTSSRQNFLTSMGSPIVGHRNGLLPLPSQFFLSLCGSVAVAQTWQLQMSLSSHHGHLCKLSLGHQAQGPIYYFRINHYWDCLRIGCGWYDLQEHILISFWSLGSGGWPSWTQGMGWLHPLSPLAPITNPMAGYVVQDLCKTGSSHWIPGHPNQIVQSFPACLLSLGPH